MITAYGQQLVIGRMSLHLTVFFKSTKNARKEYDSFVQTEVVETYEWLRDGGSDEETALAAVYKASLRVYTANIAKVALKALFASQKRESFFTVLEASSALSS